MDSTLATPLGCCRRHPPAGSALDAAAQSDLQRTTLFRWGSHQTSMASRQSSSSPFPCLLSALSRLDTRQFARSPTFPRLNPCRPPWPSRHREPIMLSSSLGLLPVQIRFPGSTSRPRELSLADRLRISSPAPLTKPPSIPFNLPKGVPPMADTRNYLSNATARTRLQEPWILPVLSAGSLPTVRNRHREPRQEMAPHRRPPAETHLASPPDEAPRCSEKGCVFPAARYTMGMCLHHHRQRREPTLFHSLQPSMVLMDQAKWLIFDPERAESRWRHRNRLAEIREQFLASLA